MFSSSEGYEVLRRACLSVCLSIRSDIPPKSRVQTSPNFLHVTRGRGSPQCSSDNNALRYTLPVSGQRHVSTQWSGMGDTNRAYTQSDSSGGSTGAKSDVYDCLVLITVFIT